MLKFIVKRLLLLIPVMFAVSVLIFALLRLNGTDAALAHARAQLNLDKPIFEQYAVWLKDAASLNFGASYITGRAVSEDMAHYFPATLKLAALGLFFTLVFPF